MTKIYYVDGLCGSKKSFKMREYVVDNFGYADRRICIIQPHNDLLKETQQKLLEEGISSLIITKQTIDGGVVSSIVDYVKYDTSQDVLLISHEAFLRIQYWDNASKWELFVDELPQVHGFKSYNIAQGSQVLPKLFSVYDTDRSDKYYLVGYKTGAASNDERNTYSELLDHDSNKHEDIFVLKSQWDGVSSEQATQIEFHWFCNPSIFYGFREVTILTANFKSSALYNMWNDRVKFCARHDISVDYTKHKLGDRKLDIYYITKQNWSKKLMKELGLGTSIEPLKAAINNVFGGQAFLWAANNGYYGTSDVPLLDIQNGTRISTKSHGLNTFFHFNNVLILSALNLRTVHNSALELLYNFSSNKQKEAVSHADIYQTIMRSSLRNENSTENVSVIVPDKAFADWFMSLFVGNVSSVQLIPNFGSNFTRTRGISKKKKAMTAAERMAKSRAKKKAEQQINNLNN